MKPNLKLAETTTPDGARLVLYEHDGSYCIRLNGQDLMHSSVTASELRLGELAAETLSGQPESLVLLGGLGAGAATVAIPGWGFLLPYVLGGNLVLLVALAVPLLRAHRCPHCRRFMGRDLGSLCPLCGAKLTVMIPRETSAVGLYC